MQSLGLKLTDPTMFATFSVYIFCMRQFTKYLGKAFFCSPQNPEVPYILTDGMERNLDRPTSIQATVSLPLILVC
jgi:hypothetical protein